MTRNAKAPNPPTAPSTREPRYEYTLRLRLQRRLGEVLGSSAGDRPVNDYDATEPVLERGAPVSYPYLRREIPADPLEDPDQPFDFVLRAYCGWLLSDPAFVREHDRLFTEWRGHVVIGGCPRFDGTSSPSGFDPEYVNSFAAFCQRWRLIGMAAPYLPLPLRPELGVEPAKVTSAMLEGGRLLYLPDLLPMPSRDELRDLLERLLRPERAKSHLRSWHQIIASKNRAKGERFRGLGHAFRVQHYWRVIHHRYPGQLARSNRRETQKELAVHLSGGDVRKPELRQRGVAKHVDQMTAQHGPDWYLSPSIC